MLTPERAQHLATRFGLDFVTVRRSRLLPDLLVIEQRIRELTATMRAERARVRAYRRARVYDRPHRLDWITREALALATYRRAKAKRARLAEEADKIKGHVARRLFA